MERNRLLLTAIILFLALTACNTNDVELVEFAPADSTGEVGRFAKFEFAFNKDLAPEDKLGTWIDADYVKFEPPIQGKFKWETPSRLVFSPEVPLMPAQDYKATVNTSVLFEDGELDLEVEPITFHTQYFGAEKIEFFYTGIPNSNYQVTAKLNLHFNYEVDPNTVKDHIEIEREGESVEGFRVVTDGASKIIAIDLGDQKQVEKDQKYKVKVLPGLASSIKDVAMKEKQEFDFVLPRLTRLAVTSVSSGLEGERGWIKVYTTQKVSEEAIRKFVSVDPKVDYEVLISDNGFRMTGGFTPGGTVKMKIKKGMPGLYGGTLEFDFEQDLALADLQPQLRFTESKGKYLMRSGLKNMEVQATNVAEVEVEYYQVFTNNLLFYLYNNDYEYYYDDYDYGYYYGRDAHVGNYGKFIHRDTVTIGDYENRLDKFNVNFADHIDQRFKGAYVVEVRDMDDRWRSDSRIVLMSDIGIIARKARDEILVFCNDLATNDPITGVEISVISSNNQTLATGKTDAQGVARIKDFANKSEDFTARLITAVKGDDFNYIDLRRNQIETSRFDVGGRAEPHELYDTYIYSERNLYRPGEKGHLTGMVRNRDMEIVKDIPVLLKIVDSRGRTINEFSKKLNEQGAFEQEFSLSATASTGEWEAEVYTGSKELMGSFRFSVEEFIPDKIRVTATGDKKELKPGQSLTIDVDAEYLFGAPAAQHSCEVDIRMQHSTYRSEKYPNFNFDNNAYNQYYGNDYFSITLDDDGKGKLSHQLPATMAAGGKLNGKAYVSVFDASGRTVNKNVSFTVDPREYYLGVKQDGYYYGVGNYAEVDVVAVNGKDKDISGFEAEVDVIRFEWRTVLKRNSSGRYRYVSEKKEIVEASGKKVKLNGGIGKFKHKITESGSYEVRVSKKGEDEYVKESFYAYGGARSTHTSFEVDREGHIDIIFDKEVYKPGDRAKVLFTTPFSGKLLVTIERDKVLSYKMIDVEKNSASISVPIGEMHLPNAYVTATLIRPHTANSSSPFFVAHGFASFKVEKKSNKLEPTIKAAEKVKPRTSQWITVNTGVQESDVFVTVALVDEGILQIKNFETPDPYGYMYAKRALSVDPYDIYEMLLPEVGSSSPAGGDESGSAKRLNPVQAQRFKLLSYWSGIRRTNSSGQVKLKVDIPQFNGEARIMAVAYKDKRFGSASAPMKISDDVVMMPAVPRALSIGDTVDVPVALMNTTGKAGSVTVTMKVEGGMKIGTKATQTAKFSGTGTETVRFKVYAGNGVGVGKMKFTTSGLDKVSDEIEIAIRPTSPLVVEDGSGSIEAGKSKEIAIPTNFLASSQNTTVTVSKFPAVKMSKHLKYIVGYPHGCLEQTTSKAFPQLYFDDLAAALAVDDNTKGSPVYFVNEAIAKIRGMQRSNGSFNYWPGGYQGNWWGTVFAAHFLVEAKRAGYVVSEDMLSDLMAYLKREAAGKETYTYEYWSNGSWVGVLRAKKEVIYSLYVLALADQADLSLMNYYRGRLHLLTPDMRYMLAGSFALANDWAAFNDIMPGSFTPTKPKRQTGGSFDSEIRANAIMLNVLMDVNPNHPQVPQLVRHLDGMMTRWQSTQDRVWAFLAMGKAAKKSANSSVTVQVMADGKVINTYTPSMGTLKVTSDAMNGKKVTLKSSGSGEVYYYWSTEGIKTTAHPKIKEEDQNLKVRRTYYDRNGAQILNNSFQQGDLIVCKVTLTGGMQSVQNVVISDLIPAGFEIENPRLSTSADLGWISNNMYPDYMDVRDDRILLFTSSSMNYEKNYHYMLRVVSSGTFQLPPIGAEAMYDASYHSYHGAGKVVVEPKPTSGI